MAHTVTITDGTTTINLTSGTSAYVENWTPATPNTSEQTASVEAIRDGGDISLVTRRNVTETLELVLVAASTTALQTLAGSIEKLLLAAERRQRWGSGDKVYVTQKLSGESYTWRSEILTGTLEYDEGLLIGGWANKRGEARLHITRRPFWEYGETSAISLSMTSATTTSATTTVTVQNDAYASSTERNYIQIASNQLTLGDLPAPLNLALYNNSGSNIGNVVTHIFANHFSDPTTLTNYFLGSSAVDGASASWASALTTHTLKYKFNLSTAQVGSMGGQFWNVWAAFTSITANTFVRAAVGDHVSTVYRESWIGEEVSEEYYGNLIYLGAVPIPRISGATPIVDLLLTFRNNASSGSAVLDFIQFAPATSYRFIRQRGFTTPTSATFVRDNGIDGELYWGSGYPLLAGRGDPIHVWPGITQRLYVLYVDVNNAWSTNAGNTFTVTASYRPRRLTI